ncbi:MAG TPA: hypothetical protein PJ982_16460, partial [Lacipirellulaceae bacterium]|nr:hypothetical protein [Lacipirellulaceae bacterium]
MLTVAGTARAQTPLVEPASENRDEDGATDDPPRLLDRTPFDRITLNADNDHAVLEVVLLDLDPRQAPDPLPSSGTLEIRLLSQPSAPYTVAWSAIARVELYEQMLLDEAQRLATKGAFASAFETLAYLTSYYPNLPGLDAALEDFLWRDASASYAAGDEEGAWSALVALYDRNPKHPRLTTAVQAVSDSLLARRLDERNYAAVRALLDVVEQRVAALELPNVARWRQRLASDARDQLTRARQALADGDFESAREAARFAYVILPELAEARALMREIQAAAPVIRVAVSESAIPAPSSQTPDWASARIADLVNPTLVEMTGFGAEGGEYGSRFGALTTADSRQETMLRLSPEAMARGILPQAVSARVVAMASADAPEGSQPLAALLRSAKLRDGQEVVFAWRRAHLHPEALLAVPLRRLAGPSGRGLWFEPIDAERPDGPQRYRRQGGPDSGPPGAPQLVVEQIFDDDDAALAALASGEVDALDRVPPWQVEQAKQASGVV